jgi:hypothetical protein
VLTTQVTYFTARIERCGIHCLLLLVLLSILQNDSVSLVVRLGLQRGSSIRRMMVGGEVQDTLHCLMVGEMVF